MWAKGLLPQAQNVVAVAVIMNLVTAQKYLQNDGSDENGT